MPNLFTRFDLKKHLSQLPEVSIDPVTQKAALKPRVLIAVLHWGIGHATRCIPIINQLQNEGFEPVLASDGKALTVLQKQFPKLDYVSLPSYNIKYTKYPKLFKIKLLVQLPKFIKAYKAERKYIKEIVKSKQIKAIISDNRFGAFYKGIPSIYMTHQLRVKSGLTTFLTSFFHKKISCKFDVCWVPDSKENPNLSGDLSHRINFKKPIEYIGLLSQFNKEYIPLKYDILILLSGPEPQRSLLEKKLLSIYKKTTKKICFVKGIVESEVRKTTTANITSYNFLLGDALQKIINQSEWVIARSGYSTIMDLALLQKKAIFIPTPGQTEQIYLANHLKRQKIADFILQENLSIETLNKLF